MVVDLVGHEDLAGDVDVEPQGLLEEVPLRLGPDPVGVEPGHAAVSLLLRAVSADLPVFVGHVLVEPQDALPAPHQPLVVVAEVQQGLPVLPGVLLAVRGQLAVALSHAHQAPAAVSSSQAQLGKGARYLLNTVSSLDNRIKISDIRHQLLTHHIRFKPKVHQPDSLSCELFYIS